GGGLRLLQVLVDRFDFLGRIHPRHGGEVAADAGACLKDPVLCLHRLQHERHEGAGGDEKDEGGDAGRAELVANPVDLCVDAALHRFTSFQAAEMEKATGCCGSFCFTSWRTSCTFDSASDCERFST